jgi:alpha-tubulin suppressor-like RCC1 family protein
MCWGRNNYGQLGNGSSVPYSATPVAVRNLDAVVSISLSPHHACALRADATAWCWGRNDYAQLGTAGGQSRSPVQVEGL